MNVLYRENGAINFHVYFGRIHALWRYGQIEFEVIWCGINDFHITNI